MSSVTNKLCHDRDVWQITSFSFSTIKKASFSLPLVSPPAHPHISCLCGSRNEVSYFGRTVVNSKCASQNESEGGLRRSSDNILFSFDSAGSVCSAASPHHKRDSRGGSGPARPTAACRPTGMLLSHRCNINVGTG